MQLQEIVDSLSLGAVEVGSRQDNTSKVQIDIAQLEEIAWYLSSLSARDSILKRQVSKVHQSSAKLKQVEHTLRTFKIAFSAMKTDVISSRRAIVNTMKRIGKVLGSYRERCRESYIDFLKNLDLDLRKILKPLVPTTIMDENVKYPRINLNPSLLSSVESSLNNTGAMNSSTNENSEQQPNKTEKSDKHKVEIKKLNEHINMLV